jgi:hypothetical protein
MGRVLGRTRLGVGASMLAALLLVASCSGTKKPEADAAAFEVDRPALLVEAAQRTAALPFRYHSTLSVEGGEGTVSDVGAVLDATALTKMLDVKGTVAGDDREVRVKTSLIAGYLDGMDVDLPIDPVGLQTEARRIEGVWYVRAPRTLFIAALQEIGAELPVDSRELDLLVSGWVRLDEGAASDDLDEFSRTALLGSETLQKIFDPVDVLAQLDQVEALEAAPGTFEGQQVTVVQATIDFHWEKDDATSAAAEDAAAVSTIESTRESLPVQVEAAIDDEGRLLSVSYGMTFGDLFAMAVPSVDVSIGGAGGDGGTFGELRLVLRTNFLDVGDDAIEVLPPEVFGVADLAD